MSVAVSPTPPGNPSSPSGMSTTWCAWTTTPSNGSSTDATTRSASDRNPGRKRRYADDSCPVRGDRPPRHRWPRRPRRGCVREPGRPWRRPPQPGAGPRTPVTIRAAAPVRPRYPARHPRRRPRQHRRRTPRSPRGHAPRSPREPPPAHVCGAHAAPLATRRPNLSPLRPSRPPRHGGDAACRHGSPPPARHDGPRPACSPPVNGPPGLRVRRGCGPDGAVSTGCVQPRRPIVRVTQPGSSTRWPRDSGSRRGSCPDTADGRPRRRRSSRRGVARRW